MHLSHNPSQPIPSTAEINPQALARILPPIKCLECGVLSSFPLSSEQWIEVDVCGEFCGFLRCLGGGVRGGGGGVREGGIVGGGVLGSLRGGGEGRGIIVRM